MIGYCDFGYGMGFFELVLMFLFWVGIIWLIVWLVNKNKNLENKTARMTPKEILNERYAKGELTKREYQEMKDQISRG